MRRHLGWVLGLALVVLGVGLQASAPHDFGWFAYAGSQVDFSGVFILTHQEMTGLGVMVLGLVVLAGSLGYVLGRRRSPRSQGSET